MSVTPENYDSRRLHDVRECALPNCPECARLATLDTGPYNEPTAEELAATEAKLVEAQERVYPTAHDLAEDPDERAMAGVKSSRLSWVVRSRDDRGAVTGYLGAESGHPMDQQNRYEVSLWDNGGGWAAYRNNGAAFTSLGTCATAADSMALCEAYAVNALSILAEPESAEPVKVMPDWSCQPIERDDTGRETSLSVIRRLIRALRAEAPDSAEMRRLAEILDEEENGKWSYTANQMRRAADTIDQRLTLSEDDVDELHEIAIAADESRDDMEVRALQALLGLAEVGAPDIQERRLSAIEVLNHLRHGNSGRGPGV